MTTFLNYDYTRQTPLRANLSVRVEVMSPAIAWVYFINDTAAMVNIPIEFRIVDMTNGEYVMPFPHTQQFVLAWTDNYQLVYGGEIIMEFANQRQWSILRIAPER